MPTRETFRRARPAWAALHLAAALSLAACEDFSGPRPGDGTLPRASWTRPAPGDGSPHPHEYGSAAVGSRSSLSIAYFATTDTK